jgi:aspartate--ammonia ligase
MRTWSVIIDKFSLFIILQINNAHLYPILERSVEISSMGIRVDEKALVNQLKLSNNDDRLQLEFHLAILNKELLYTIGGGIGQSRLCMFLLKKAHIGEVQVSVWNDQTIEDCKKGNITLL